LSHSLTALGLCVLQAHDIYKQLHDLNLRDLRGETIGKVINTPYRSLTRPEIPEIYEFEVFFLLIS